MKKRQSGQQSKHKATPLPQHKDSTPGSPRNATPQGDSLVQTLLIIGAIGAVIVSLLAITHHRKLLVGSACGTMLVLALAGCLKWQTTRRWLWFGIGAVALVVISWCIYGLITRENLASKESSQAPPTTEASKEGQPVAKPTAPGPVPNAKPTTAPSASPDSKARRLKEEGESLMSQNKYVAAEDKFTEALRIPGTSTEMVSQLRALIVRAQTRAERSKP